MNTVSNNQRLQNLQNLHSTQKKAFQYSHSPKPSEINQLLHCSSPVPYFHIQQYDVGQLTDRIVREMDKHTSFNQNENPLEIQPYQYSHANQPTFISQLTHIDKKLKQLKYAKDHDHNIFVAILTKMKLYCLDNSTICFDFYRCTDLILLKYMIYLLILELNQEIPNNKQESIPDQSQQFQSMVKDIVIIIYEIIEKIKSKQHINSQMDTLNNQLTKIQNSFKPQLNSSVKTIKKQSHHRGFGSCNLENNNTTIHQNKLTTEISTNSKHQLNDGQQKIIKYQIDELEQKVKHINSLNDQILKLQNNNKQQILSISELNVYTESIKSQLQSKTDEVCYSSYTQKLSKYNRRFFNCARFFKLIEILIGCIKYLQISYFLKKNLLDKLEQLKMSYELLKSNSQLCMEEKEQYFNLYHDYELENIKLKQNLEKYQTAHEQIKTQFDQYQNETYLSYQQQCTSLQQTKDNEIKQLKIELNEKSTIINQLLEDALFFGKHYKQIIERIVTIQKEDFGKEMQQLQKEILYLQNIVNVKFNAISCYSDNILYDSGQEFLLQSQLSNKLVNKTSSSKSGNHQQSRSSDFLNAYKNQFELMHMLLAQCQVLEDFLS